MLDAFGSARIEREDAGELVATQARQQPAARQQRTDTRRRLLQDLVATLVAVEVVDLLEIVQVDHDQRQRLAVLLALVDHDVDCAGQAAPVETSGERVDLGEQPCFLLCLAGLVDFLRQFLVAAPAEQDQSNVEEHRVDQQGVRSLADALPRAHDLRQHLAAGADEQDDRGNRDTERHEIAIAGTEGAEEFALVVTHMPVGR